MIDAFVFVFVVTVAVIIFSGLAYLADRILRRISGRGIVPEDYYK
jgi:hypothetical protein